MMWERDQRDIDEMSSGRGNGNDLGYPDEGGKLEDRGHILGGTRAMRTRRMRQESGTNV